MYNCCDVELMSKINVEIKLKFLSNQHRNDTKFRRIFDYCFDIISTLNQPIFYSPIINNATKKDITVNNLAYNKIKDKILLILLNRKYLKNNHIRQIHRVVEIYLHILLHKKELYILLHYDLIIQYKRNNY